MKAVIGLVCLSIALAAGAEESVLPRVDAPFVIDGDLSDAGWDQALRIERFYEIAPGDNVEPRMRTRAWLAYDARSLYVAFRADDPSPREIRAPFLARDRVLADQDFVQIDIDAQNDGKSSTLFRVNPRGIQTDGVYTESEGRDDFAPDFNFQSAARVTAEGWQAEMRIPLASLRYPKADPQTWGVTLYRIVPRERRYEIRSTAVVRGSGCWLCNALRVGGITALPPGGGMTVAPYTTSRAVDAPGVASYETRTELGGDFKWLPTASLSLDATIRPDFSQIETDAAQLAVNSRFAIFYPEKRPFFMEGADLLSSPIPAIHTRTITSPLWGARLTARPGNHAFTLILADDRGGGSVIVPGPAFSSFSSQPDHQLSAIGRYRYSRGRSSGGLLLTSRRSREGQSNTVTGPDLLWWPRQTDRLRAQVLFSRTTGETGEDDGHAAVLSWDRYLRYFSSSVSVRDLGEGFRADSGFVPQTGIRATSARAGWMAYPRFWFTRVQSDLYYERIAERDGALVSENIYPRVYAEGWRATAFILELHPNEKSRAANGSIHAQDYATAAVRFLLSRRIPYLKVAGRYGDELDVEEARVGRGATLSLLASLQPVDPLQVELSGEAHRLDLDAGRLFDAQTVRAMTTWTFSPRSFVRVVAERQAIRWNEALAPRNTPRSGFVNASVLFAYRPTWQSCLYLGYGDARLLDGAGVLGAPRRDLFFKLSYALDPQAPLKGIR